MLKFLVEKFPQIDSSVPQTDEKFPQRDEKFPQIEILVDKLKKKF